MERDIDGALFGIAISGISVGIEAMRILVRAGLASPEDVDQLAITLTAHFSDPGMSPAEDRVRDAIDMRYGNVFAELREAARTRWKG